MCFQFFSPQIFTDYLDMTKKSMKSGVKLSLSISAAGGVLNFYDF